MMSSVALFTAVSWLCFSFHVMVAHPLVDSWHHLSPGHDLSGMTHAHCEQEEAHHGCSCAHGEPQDSHTSHCHAFHPDAAKAQYKTKHIAPPVFSLVDLPDLHQMFQPNGTCGFQATNPKAPPEQLFITHKSFLI